MLQFLVGKVGPGKFAAERGGRAKEREREREKKKKIIASICLTPSPLQRTEDSWRSFPTRKGNSKWIKGWDRKSRLYRSRVWIVAFSELLILLHCISIELGIVVLAFVDGLLIFQHECIHKNVLVWKYGANFLKKSAGKIYSHFFFNGKGGRGLFCHGITLALAELVVVNDLHVCWLFLALPFLAHYIFSGIPLRFFALSFLYKFDVHNLNPWTDDYHQNLQPCHELFVFIVCLFFFLVKRKKRVRQKAKCKILHHKLAAQS